MNSTLLLFSGGIDSSLIAAALKPDSLLFVNYGQICAPTEWRAAQSIAKAIGIKLDIIQVDLLKWGSGRLADGNSRSSFWPYRNQMLLTLAAMSSPEIDQIWIGSCPTDIYDDCSADFIDSFNNLINSQGSKTLVRSPLFDYQYSQLIDRVANLDIFNLTSSCHAAKAPCGQCPGCEKQIEFRKRHLK